MARTDRPRPVVLCILDGWGESSSDDHNAIRLADTPTWAHPAPTAEGLLVRDAETLALWRWR